MFFLKPHSPDAEGLQFQDFEETTKQSTGIEILGKAGHHGNPESTPVF